MRRLLAALTTPGIFLLDDLDDLLAAEDAALDLDSSVSEWTGGA